MIRKDYKRKPTKTLPLEGPSSVGRGFLLGLLVGLAFAGAVHVYHTIRTPSTPPFVRTLPPQQPVQPEQQVEAEPKISDRDVHNTLIYGADVLLPDWQVEYILQAKSYHTPEEAELLKQRVLKLGYKSTIHIIEESDEKWYRVELGPYRELQDINEVRMHLKNNRIETLVKQQKSE